MPSRRQIALISPQALVALMRGEIVLDTPLPPDVSVAGFAIDPFTDCIAIRLTSDSFEEVPDYQVAPTFTIQARKVYAEVL